MPPKLSQSDISCDLNTDGDTIEETATNKDAGKAVDEALNQAKTKAKSERTSFLAFHCPPTTKHTEATCPDKLGIKGDTDDDLVPLVISVDFDKVKKTWTARCSYTWNASFVCGKKSK